MNYLTVGDGTEPIFMVKSASGWAHGPGNMALVHFTDISNKDFFLSFNEASLWQTILYTMLATETYKGAPTRPVIAVSNITAGLGKDEVLIRMEVTPEARVHFRTSKAEAKKLLESLQKLEL